MQTCKGLPEEVSFGEEPSVEALHWARVGFIQNKEKVGAQVYSEGERKF